MQPDGDIVYCNSIAINELTPLNGIYFLSKRRRIRSQSSALDLFFFYFSGLESGLVVMARMTPPPKAKRGSDSLSVNTKGNY